MRLVGQQTVGDRLREADQSWQTRENAAMIGCTLDTHCGQEIARVIATTEAFIASLPDLREHHREAIWQAAKYQCECIYFG